MPDPKVCEWCDLPVTDKQTDESGNHRDIYACKAALRNRVVRLEVENESLKKQIAEKDRALRV